MRVLDSLQGDLEKPFSVSLFLSCSETTVFEFLLIVQPPMISRPPRIADIVYLLLLYPKGLAPST